MVSATVRAAAGHELSRRPLVVLHVTRSLDRLGVHDAFEFPEDLAVGLPDDVGEHVEPPPVRHAERRLRRCLRSAASSKMASSKHDGRLGPFEAVALLTDVAGVEEALEGLGRVEPIEDVALLVGGQGGGDPFDVLLDPALLLGVLNVHVLDPERAAVGVSQDVERLAQREHVASRQTVHDELPIEIPQA